MLVAATCHTTGDLQVETKAATCPGRYWLKLRPLLVQVATGRNKFLLLLSLCTCSCYRSLQVAYKLKLRPS